MYRNDDQTYINNLRNFSFQRYQKSSVEVYN